MASQHNYQQMKKKQQLHILDDTSNNYFINGELYEFNEFLEVA